jgi:antitoxin YefM
MIKTTIKKLQTNLDEIITPVLDADEDVIVKSQQGNLIMLSESKYRSLLESLYLSSNQELKDSILDGLNTTFDQTISETDIEW